MGYVPNVFTIRLREATVQVCRGSLLQAEYPKGSDYEFLATKLKERIQTVGLLTLNIGEALVLHEVVEDAAHNLLREGSELHNEALMFAGALDDHCRTAYHDDVRLSAWAKQRRQDFEAQEEMTKAVKAANRAEAQEKALRDAMLGEVFLGGPRKSINIWGQVIGEPAPMSKEEFRAKAKTTTPEMWRDAMEKDRADIERERKLITNKMGAAMQYKASVRIRLHGTKPIADGEADDLLTGNKPMNDYTKDMQVEGAKTLLEENTKIMRDVQYLTGIAVR